MKMRLALLATLVIFVTLFAYAKEPTEPPQITELTIAKLKKAGWKNDAAVTLPVGWPVKNIYNKGDCRWEMRRLVSGKNLLTVKFGEERITAKHVTLFYFSCAKKKVKPPETPDAILVKTTDIYTYVAAREKHGWDLRGIRQEIEWYLHFGNSKFGAKIKYGALDSVLNPRTTGNE